MEHQGPATFLRLVGLLAVLVFLDVKLKPSFRRNFHAPISRLSEPFVRHSSKVMEAFVVGGTPIDGDYNSCQTVEYPPTDST